MPLSTDSTNGQEKVFTYKGYTYYAHCDGPDRLSQSDSVRYCERMYPSFPESALATWDSQDEWDAFKTWYVENGKVATNKPPHLHFSPRMA